MIEERDKLLGISTEEKKRDRTDIPTHEIATVADASQKGEAFQLKDDGTSSSSPVTAPQAQ